RAPDNPSQVSGRGDSDRRACPKPRQRAFRKTAADRNIERTLSTKASGGFSVSLHVVELGPIPPPEGGVSRQIVAIKDRLTDRGIKCTLVATTRSDPDHRSADNVYPESPLALVSILRESDADIFHLHLGGEITLRVLALALAVAKTARCSILTMHSGGFPKAIAGSSIFRRKFAASILKKFDRVIAVSGDIADALRELGVPPE